MIAGFDRNELNGDPVWHVLGSYMVPCRRAIYDHTNLASKGAEREAVTGDIRERSKAPTQLLK